MTDAKAVPIKDLILVPSIITLAVTLLRLVGELQNWSPALFGKAAGGGGALVGISWLVPVFGIYFAMKLARAGSPPQSAGKVIGFSLLAVVLMVVVGFGGNALGLGLPGQLLAFGVASWAAIALFYPTWTALARTLLVYAFAARIPVAIVMLVAIFGNWGTHYDVAPPNASQVDAMAPLVKWLWIGLLPQMTIWIWFTIVGGGLFGGIAAAIAGRSKS